MSNRIKVGFSEIKPFVGDKEEGVKSNLFCLLRCFSIFSGEVSRIKFSFAFSRVAPET